MPSFREMLEARWALGKFVCVGLDSEFDKIPVSARQPGNERDVSIENTIVAFNRAIVDATQDLVCAYKPNIAFYEAHGDEGLGALHRTIMDIHAIAPDIPVILDAKRADIGNTNNGYVQMAFNFMNADAITVHPYLGATSLKPFLSQSGKMVFVLCRTSNPDAGEFQDLLVQAQVNLPLDPLAPVNLPLTEPKFLPLYQYVARRVAQWEAEADLGLVVGATYPEELRIVREIAPNLTLLIPGIGKQGGDLEKSVLAGRNATGTGFIINVSSGIIFASSGADFADAARAKLVWYTDEINRILASDPIPTT